ncbi:MAG: HAMP domain-containing histidine kinase [Ruminococcus sp.]|nr:HAMP domain-containing histidine kinase [Ruminococcus sp.]
MDIIESAIAILKASNEMAAVVDAEFAPVWTGNDAPEETAPEGLIAPDGSTLVLPLEKEAGFRTRKGLTVRVTPLHENGETKGYALRFSKEPPGLPLSDPARMQEFFFAMGRIREHLSGFTQLADRLLTDGFNGISPQQLGHDIKLGTLKVLASTVNLSELSKLMSRESKTECIDASGCLTKIMDYLDPIAEANGCEIVCRLGGEHLTCLARYDELETALLNLLVNAAGYCDASHKFIWVSLSCDAQGYTVFTVSDNGTSADIERITEMSYYGQREYAGGTNETLGLAAVRAFAEKNGGSLEFAPSETGGLTVTLRLPRNTGDGVMTFNMKRMPDIIMPYDRQYCIIAKAFDPFIKPKE